MTDKNQKNKTVLISLLPFLLAAVLIIGALRPTPVAAVIPVTDLGLQAGQTTQTVKQAQQDIWTRIQKKMENFWKRSGSRAFQQAVRTVTYKFAQDTATWIATGDKGQKPLLFSDPIKFLTDAPDQIAGDFLVKISASFPIDLCSAASIKSKLAINIGINKSLMNRKFGASDLGKPGCKLSAIKNNFAEAAQAKNFLVNVSTTFEPGKNDISTSSILFDEAKRTQQKFEAAELIRREQPVTTKDLQDLINNNPQTPKELIVQAQLDAAAAANKQIKDPLRTEDIFYDTLAVFANTLTVKYMQKLQGGYYPFRKTGGNSPDSELVGSAGSVKALLSSFDVFSPERAAKVSTTGEVDLFSEVVSCPPPQYQSPYNCLLNDGLQQAIQQGLTVQQALAKGLLDADLPFPQPFDPTKPTLSLENLRKLRFLRVLPVGWELAAAKLQNEKNKITLGSVIKCFSAPPVTQPQPPAAPITDSCAGLRGLIDPAWVLALPQTYCRAEGIGNVPENEQSSSRQRWCVDLQSCVKEDAKGNCQAYGYCTRERALWKLQGEECSRQYATCQVLYRPDGGTVGTSTTPGILGSDINKNGCSQANAGCTWFSKTRTGDTTWDANSRIYLTASAASCRAEDAGSREIIPLEAGTNLIRGDQSGQRVDIKPYTYYTLSFDVDAQAPVKAWVDGAGISNVSFSSLVNNSAILDLPGDSRGRYAATFFSQGAGNVTVAFNSQSFSRVQLEEVSLLDGQRAQDAFAANRGAGIAVLNSSPAGSRNPAAPATAYKLYQDNRKLVFAGANECSADEASARKYTAVKGGDTQVARLLAGDLCPAACVGLDSYLAMPTKLENFSHTAGDYPKRQSFIAQYGQSCNGAEVGCEEFTNIAPTPGSAEKREYYSQVRSCVLDTNPQAATYYTWQGTDTAGFQLKAWQLLKESDSGAPCNNFTPNTGQSSAEAVCAPGRADDCVLGSANPNCRVFLDETGQEYKRDMTKIVTASKDCTGYRRSVDGQTWYFLAKESQQCTAANVSCREYKGAKANVARRILFDDFESKTRENWDYTPALSAAQESRALSPDATILNGRSLRVFNGRIILKTYGELAADQGGLPTDYSFKNKTYVVKFLAKAEGDGGRLARVYLEAGVQTEGDFPTGGSATGVAYNVLNLNQDWNYYTVGPLYYDKGDQPNLGIEAAGSDVLLDNIELVEVQDNIYLKTDSWLAAQPAECAAYNQCEAYKDDNNNTFYASRFAKLFGPDSAYCRAVIDTQNSDKPDGEVFNQDNVNDNPDDNYTVAADNLEYRIIKPENLRPAAAAGCTALGAPNDIANPTDWTGTVYRIVDPDAFKQGAMCRAEGVGCQNFKNNDGQSFVFRDPGKKLCVWSQAGYFVRQNADGTPTDISCYGPNGENTGWVAQCPAEQSSCTAYVPTDANYTEGAATSLFMKKDTVEAGDCQLGDKIDSGCVNFREGFTESHVPPSNADIKEDLLAGQQTRLLAVKPGRACAQWLAPTTSSEVIDPQTRNKRTVVYALGSCQAIASDGKCTQWANQTKAVLDTDVYQNRNKGEFAGKNIFSGAWDYSGYSIPGKAQVDKLALEDMTAACRSYPEEDAPFSSAGLDVDPKTGKFIYKDNVLKNVNKCEPGENCECSYKKVDSTEEGTKYYATSTASVLPETTESITNLNGWRGYCLETDSSKRDPNGNPVCVNWWPVDVPSEGVNIFDNHPEAGFSLAGPMYYCAQAKGNKLINDEFGIGPMSVANNNYLISVRKDARFDKVINYDEIPWYTYRLESNNNFGVVQTSYIHKRTLYDVPLSFYPTDVSGEDKNYNWDIDCTWNQDNTDGGCTKDMPYVTQSHTYDNNGWSNASGVIPFPVNNLSPLANLREYDIEKIILKPRQPVQGIKLYSDWPSATEQLILQRDGWANNGETTKDRWTALWCNGDKCDFGKDGYSWERFEPIIEDLGNTPGNKACSDLMKDSNTNLLGIRAVFADSQGMIPGEEDWRHPIGFLRRILLALANHSQRFANWGLPSKPETSFLGKDSDGNRKVKPFQFLGFEGGLCDASPGEGWVDFDIAIQTREWCSVVAKVDGNGDNKAWTGRLNQKSTTPYPGYYSADLSQFGKGALTNLYIKQTGTAPANEYNAYYSQDSSPFGSIVPPAATIYHPDEWDSRKDQEDEDPTAPQAEPKLLEPGQQPLYVEAGRKQVRAGTPYSCGGDACVLPPTDKGVKIKPEARIDRDEERLDKAKTYLLQLFGKIQKLWRWQVGEDKYKEETATGLDLADAGECPVIQAITQEAGAEWRNNTLTGNCLFANGQGGNYSINNQAIKPGQSIIVNRGEPVKLQFYAYNQNGEQLPLKKIQIDWGNVEGQPADVMTINGAFKNHKPVCDDKQSGANYGDSAKACSPEYFQFEHVYRVEGSYTPKVIITDNWGRQTEATYSHDVLTVEIAVARQASTIAASAIAAACTEDIWTYSDYGACSAEGKRTRTATINFNCPNVTTPPILTQDCANGGWSPWRPPVGAGYPDGNTPVGTCSTACGRGQQVRRCNAPSPSGGGSECLLQNGSTGMEETRACNTQPCPTDADHDGYYTPTDCADNDPKIFPGSTYQSTVSKDYNCDGTATPIAQCTANAKDFAVSGECGAGRRPSKAVSDAWCARKFPGHAGIQASDTGSGYCNNVNEIECVWCSASRTVYN